MSDEHDPTLADYTSIVDSYSTDSDPEMRLTVADALLGRALLHHTEGDHAAAIADLTLIVDSYSTGSDPEMR